MQSLAHFVLTVAKLVGLMGILHAEPAAAENPRYTEPLLMSDLDLESAQTNPIFIKKVLDTSIILVGRITHVQPHPHIACGVVFVHQRVSFELFRTLKGSLEDPKVDVQFPACSPLPTSKFTRGHVLVVFVRGDSGSGRGLSADYFWELHSKRLEEAINEILRQQGAYSGSKILPSLVSGINDGTVPIEEAATALRQLGHASISVLETLTKHSRKEVRKMAVRTLLGATYPDWSTRDSYGEKPADRSYDARLTQTLAPRLDDPSHEVQAAAARSLGFVGPGAAKAAPTLARLLRSKEEEEVRVEAASAIEKIKYYEPSMKPHLLAAFDDQREWIRDVMRRSVGTLRPTPDWAIDKLREEVAHGDKATCDVLDSYLAMGGEARAATDQVVHVLESGTGCAQIKASYVLGHIAKGSARAHELLIKTIQGPNKDLWPGAIDSLARLGVQDQRIPPVLHKFLAGSDQLARGAAISAISMLGIEDDTSIDSLVHVLKNERDPGIKCSAYEVLNGIRRTRSRKAVEGFSANKPEEKERCLRIRAYQERQQQR